ncbi:MAG: hypothetical protein ABIF11_05765 [Nitrospirota bacterium]
MSGYKSKPYGRMLLMGAISIVLYTILLMKQDLINHYFGNGGLYAVLPIVIAFIFSYFHGTFTSCFWTVLGIEAAKENSKHEIRNTKQ